MQSTVLSAATARSRAILRSDMVACKLAFIDCKLPGSDSKENYSLIGPGVTQSDEQFVNLTEPHGFSVGVASMPPATTNNLHLHFTAEVFMVQKGRWLFRWGDGTRQGELEGGPGDVLSMPTWIFRGFSNIGEDTGWIITALGGDDTGGIIWHPSILSAAAEHGMHLTRDNLLVDLAAGAPLPDREALMQPLTPDDMAGLRWWTPDEMRQRVLPAAARNWSSTALLGALVPGAGCELAPAIGYGLTEQRGHLAPIAGPHGFSVDWLRLAPGGSTSHFLLQDKQVLCVTRGSVDIVVNNGPEAVTIRLDEQDVYATPAGVWREIRAAGPQGAELTLVTSGDHRKRVAWSADVTQAAQRSGFAIDPDGRIAKLRLLPPSAIGVGVLA